MRTIVENQRTLEIAQSQSPSGRGSRRGAPEFLAVLVRHRLYGRDIGWRSLGTQLGDPSPWRGCPGRGRNGRRAYGEP